MSEQKRDDHGRERPIDDRDLEHVDGGAITGGLADAPGDQHDGDDGEGRRSSHLED